MAETTVEEKPTDSSTVGAFEVLHNDGEDTHSLKDEASLPCRQGSIVEVRGFFEILNANAEFPSLNGTALHLQKRRPVGGPSLIDGIRKHSQPVATPTVPKSGGIESSVKNSIGGKITEKTKPKVPAKKISTTRMTSFERLASQKLDTISNKPIIEKTSDSPDKPPELKKNFSRSGSSALQALKKDKDKPKFVLNRQTSVEFHRWPTPDRLQSLKSVDSKPEQTLPDIKLDDIPKTDSLNDTTETAQINRMESEKQNDDYIKETPEFVSLTTAPITQGSRPLERFHSNLSKKSTGSHTSKKASPGWKVSAIVRVPSGPMSKRSTIPNRKQAIARRSITSSIASKYSGSPRPDNTNNKLSIEPQLVSTEKKKTDTSYISPQLSPQPPKLPPVVRRPAVPTQIRNKASPRGPLTQLSGSSDSARHGQRRSSDKPVLPRRKKSTGIKQTIQVFAPTASQDLSASSLTKSPSSHLGQTTLSKTGLPPKRASMLTMFPKRVSKAKAGGKTITKAKMKAFSKDKPDNILEIDNKETFLTAEGIAGDHGDLRLVQEPIALLVSLEDMNVSTAGVRSKRQSDSSGKSVGHTMTELPTEPFYMNNISKTETSRNSKSSTGHLSSIEYPLQVIADIPPPEPPLVREILPHPRYLSADIPAGAFPWELMNQYAATVGYDRVAHHLPDEYIGRYNVPQTVKGYPDVDAKTLSERQELSTYLNHVRGKKEMTERILDETNKRLEEYATSSLPRHSSTGMHCSPCCYKDTYNGSSLDEDSERRKIAELQELASNNSQRRNSHRRRANKTDKHEEYSQGGLLSRLCCAPPPPTNNEK